MYNQFAAASDNSLANMFLGYRYLHGISTERNLEKAAHHYYRAARKCKFAWKKKIVAIDCSCFHVTNIDCRNLAAASYKGYIFAPVKFHRLVSFLSSDSANAPSEDDVVNYYQYAANHGDPNAQNLLGQLYFQGSHGLPQNFELARRYFDAAAEDGNDYAATELGYMYWQGDGVERNFDLARKYFERGAVKNFPMALNGIGLLHLHGAGVPQDFQKAYSYFKSAHDVGSRQNDLIYPDASFNLGVIYLLGLGVQRHYGKAASLFTLASQHGHT